MTSALDACRLIVLPKIESHAGAITPVQGNDEVPFEIERVFFLYDVVAGAERGGHAHRLLKQVYVAAMGSFSVVLDDGRERRTVDLKQPNVGLYIPTMVWSQLVEFASGTIAVVLASRHYDESEYLRNYEEYRHAVGESTR
jgi:hypothetical protein